MYIYMERGISLKKNKVAIIGGGPAGAMAAIHLAKTKDFDITIFDNKSLLSTLLPTGGGRCNLTYYEYDNIEFVKNYPRGSKFLLSALSKFNATDTMGFFNELGIDVFVQDDNRIFPCSESSKEVAKTLQMHLKENNVKHCKEQVIEIQHKKDNYNVISAASSNKFDIVIISTGGKGNGHQIAKKLNHSITPLTPSLTGLKILEKEFHQLSGISLEKIEIEAIFKKKKVAEAYGDILFTHNSISGPGIFKISALCAYLNYSLIEPLTIKIKLTNLEKNEIISFIQENIKKTPKKNLKNVFSQLIPKRLCETILNNKKIPLEKEITHINKNEIETITKALTELELTVFDKCRGEEIVTAGGVNLNELNPQTMESKICPNLYFCGEIIDIDGFTGGFNLQNCWTTAFICAEGIKKNAISGALSNNK